MCACGCWWNTIIHIILYTSHSYTRCTEQVGYCRIWSHKKLKLMVDSRLVNTSRRHTCKNSLRWSFDVDIDIVKCKGTGWQKRQLFNNTFKWFGVKKHNICSVLLYSTFYLPRLLYSILWIIVILRSVSEVPVLCIKHMRAFSSRRKFLEIRYASVGFRPRMIFFLNHIIIFLPYIILYVMKKYDMYKNVLQSSANIDIFKLIDYNQKKYYARYGLNRHWCPAIEFFIFNQPICFFLYIILALSLLCLRKKKKKSYYGMMAAYYLNILEP